MKEIGKVKDFWEKNTPQYWYSNKQNSTREYFDELQLIRYSKTYPYLKTKAEFELHRGKKVLEIGCGQGTDLLQFAKNGADVTGVDLTEGAIEKSKELFNVYGLPAILLTANAEKLDEFEENTFDVVYSFGVLHHTPNTEKALTEVHRVLKKGGKAIVMLYATGISHNLGAWYWQYLRMECLSMSAGESMSLHGEYVDGCPIIKYYSKQTARELFAAFDYLEIERLLCYHYLPAGGAASMGRRLRYRFYGFLNRWELTHRIFGHNILIKAIK